MNWLKLLFQYFPLVLSGVVAIEGALKGTPGATKKQILLNVLTAGAGVAQQIPQGDVQQVGKVIDIVVGALNKSGVFVKDTPATVPGPVVVLNLPTNEPPIIIKPSA